MASLVNVFHATKGRLTGTDARSVIAALLADDPDSISVNALSIIFYIGRDQPGIDARDLLELATAKAADLEGVMDEGDADLQSIADYMVTTLDTLPTPIPRCLLQQLAIALVNNGDEIDRIHGVQHLLANYTFA